MDQRPKKKKPAVAEEDVPKNSLIVGSVFEHDTDAAKEFLNQFIRKAQDENDAVGRKSGHRIAYTSLGRHGVCIQCITDSRRVADAWN